MRAPVLFVYLMVVCALSPRTQAAVGSAVDVKGRRYTASRGSSGFGAPWFSDCIYFQPPLYPYAARAQWSQGEGLFRASLDTRTGVVTKVAVIKSTGYGLLDNSAIAAIRKWRWKPGKWKEIDVPINFTMVPRHR